MSGEVVINYVYLTSIMPTSRGYIEDIICISNENHSDAEFWEYVNKFFPEYSQENSRKKFKNFLAHIKKDQYYFFILTKEMLPYWENTIDEFSLREHFVWSSKQMAVNSNYPEDGPRLKAYLLKGFNWSE